MNGCNSTSVQWVVSVSTLLSLHDVLAKVVVSVSFIIIFILNPMTAKDSNFFSSDFSFIFNEDFLYDNLPVTTI